MHHPVHRAELERVLAVIKEHDCRSVIEIGSRHGLTLIALACAMKFSSRVVSVDKPGKAWGSPGSEVELEKNVSMLRLEGYDVHLIAGMSQEAHIIEQAKALGPYGLAYIDADHRYDAVKADWEVYGPMASIVCFHDIAVDPPEVIKRPDDDFGVKRLWNEIKGDYRHEEVIHDDPRVMGTGILYRE